MQLYDCKVRLDGKITNEVRKQGVTAAEIICMQHIHGSDAVIEIEPGKTVQANHEDVREHLQREYGPGLLRRELSIFDLFGPVHQPLPLKLPKSVGAEPPAPRRRKAPASGSVDSLFAA